ncbi:MAG: glycosyltransferase [Treponema sp.]|nr:glycosyltransferase [Treponema sp.]
MQKPKISIVLPIFNVEKYLPQCIESVINQSFIDFELILVNDFSKDKSFDICKLYKEKDNRIKIINNNKNYGCSLSRKIGLNSASGEYILFIDSDDWIEKSMLSELFNAATLDNYDIVYCDYYYYDILGNPTYIKSTLYNDTVKNIKEFILGSGKGVFLWNKLVKRQIYKKIEFPIEGYAEDKYITLQLFHEIKKIGYVNFALYHFRYNLNSMSRNPNFQISRFNDVLGNYTNILFYLFVHYSDLSIFQPELNKRIKYIEIYNPKNISNIIKSILKSIVPSREVQYFIRNILNRFKSN